MARVIITIEDSTDERVLLKSRFNPVPESAENLTPAQKAGTYLIRHLAKLQSEGEKERAR